MTEAAIRAELTRLADPKIEAVSRRFFKTAPGEYGEGDLFRGIRVPVLRRLARKYGSLSLAEAELLLHSSYHEDRLLALLILVRHFAKAEETKRRRIYLLYLKNTRYINNWDLVDASAEHIVGAFLRNKKRDPLYRLSKSGNLWERRIAILSTFHFIKNGEFDETLKIAQRLLADSEGLVHKAAGWMLREIGKRDLAVAESFLRIHHHRMPRTMLRYAIERFPEQKRQNYLQGKIS